MQVIITLANKMGGRKITILYKYIALLLAALLLIISGAYAMGISATAGAGPVTAGFSITQSVRDNAVVEDSTVLSFNGGVGLERDASILGGILNFEETHEISTIDTPVSATSGTTARISNAESLDEPILNLDPKTVTPSTKTVSAGWNLNVLNATSIYTSVYGSSIKGDYAEQSISLESTSGKASLIGFNNKATTTRTSALATQKFISAKSDESININGFSSVTPNGYIDPLYFSEMKIAAEGYGDPNKPFAEVNTFLGTSSARTENNVESKATAGSIYGMDLAFSGSSFNPEGDGTLIDDKILGNNDIGTPRKASIKMYIIDMDAIAASASEKRSYESVSAGKINISDFAMNNQSDIISHNLDANSYYASGKYTPAIVDVYNAQNFKAQKASVSGTISILDASGGYLGVSAQSTHSFKDDYADYSFGQVSGSNAALEKVRATQSYKVALSAAPKATSVTYSTIRGKGTGYQIYTLAYSNALDDSMMQIAMPGKQKGRGYTASASTKSSGILGNTKSADVAANIKLTSTY